MKKLYHPTSNTLGIDHIAARKSIQIEDLISLSSIIRKVYVNEQTINYQSFTLSRWINFVCVLNVELYKIVN